MLATTSMEVSVNAGLVVAEKKAVQYSTYYKGGETKIESAESHFQHTYSTEK